MTAAAAYERICANPRFAGYSGVAHVILATALVAGAPLRPISSSADLETLVVAEYLVRREGLRAGAALERARVGRRSLAELRGVVRFAASRHAEDHLGPELGLLGVAGVHELDREQAVELARWLFSLPAEAGEAVILAELERFGAKPVLEEEVEGEALEDGAVELELETDVRGTLLAPCHRCGAAVGDDDPLIGVRYRIISTKKERPDRFEWRVASPALERGEHDEAAEIAKRKGKERRSAFLRQVGAGAELLCWRCATRLRYGLIKAPESPHEELDREWLEATARDRDPEPLKPDMETGSP